MDTEQVIVLLFAFQDIIGRCVFPETEIAPTNKLGKIRLHKTFMGKSRLSRWRNRKRWGKSKLRICDNQLFYQRRYLVRHLLGIFRAGASCPGSKLALSLQSQPGKQIPFNQTSSVLYTEPGIKETGFWAGLSVMSRFLLYIKITGASLS